MDAVLEQLILERLDADEDLAEAAADLVVAACDGPDALDAAIGGTVTRRVRGDGQLELAATAPGAYLRSVTVQGFRGVGPAATLDLAPGPGLTVVAGRNGSGKSSFAEGVELLMTGESARWAKRTAVWKAGWQNLHVDDETVLAAELTVDGRPGTTSLRRRWDHGVKLDAGDCEARHGDGSATTLDELGWTAALSRYRPFLSFNELGQMFDELKTMYEALSAILGLDDLEALADDLRTARLARDKRAKGLKKDVQAFHADLAPVDDDRARAVAHALDGVVPDLDTVELTLEGVDTEATEDLGRLRALAALTVPSAAGVDAALDALAAARAAAERTAGTDAGRAQSLARLLEAALEHDERHQDPECPVCGTAGVIDERWRLETTRAIAGLQTDARAAEQATSAVRAARRRVGDLLAPEPPAMVTGARDLGLDPGAVEHGWERWREERDALDDEDAVARLRDGLDALRTAAEQLATAARDELDRREDAWRPLAVRLTRWLPDAREAVTAQEALPVLKAAERWAVEQVQELRTERLAPIAQAARANWETLRQDSNVSLEGFHLRKSGNTRSAEVDVRVDGTDASAFGVMSQGELHALAVSVFLPRAALPESPFRFMVIDDPVQSMDPSKVDGLARVLERAAATRQVVVFTHDERLPEACRRLRIPVTVLEVTRRPRSVVELREALSPVQRHLRDAGDLLKDDRVPPAVAARVVPGFCRHAVEASCAQVVRRRRLGQGAAHAEVESTLEGARTLYQQLALAIYDDPARSGDVVRGVAQRWGDGAAATVKRLNAGTHEGDDGDLGELHGRTRALARELAELT